VFQCNLSNFACYCQIYVFVHVIGLNIDAYGLKFVTVIDINARIVAE